MVFFIVFLGLGMGWFGINKIRSYRYLQITREYYARWTLLSPPEKKRLLSYCYPDRTLSQDGEAMNELFSSFMESKWREMKDEKFYDFDAFQTYLSKLIAYASCDSDKITSHESQPLT